MLQIIRHTKGFSGSFFGGGEGDSNTLNKYLSCMVHKDFIKLQLSIVTRSSDTVTDRYLTHKSIDQFSD